MIWPINESLIVLSIVSIMWGICATLLIMAHELLLQVDRESETRLCLFEGLKECEVCVHGRSLPVIYKLVSSLHVTASARAETHVGSCQRYTSLTGRCEAAWLSEANACMAVIGSTRGENDQ